MGRVSTYSVSQVSEAASTSNGRVATRYVELAWLGMFFPPACLIAAAYVLHQKGVTVGSFLYLFDQPGVSPVRPILGAIAFLVWLAFYPWLAGPVLFKTRTAIAMNDHEVSFFGRSFALQQVDRFERRQRGLLEDLVIVLKDGTEFSASNSFVRGFPV